ncbi:hypothetical protein DFH09DRAFT_1373271 [Mycena vulgaris]|nr:hypothetical protein DFH09DRAFT_1373271 [Mycena vulgaris]
MGTESHLPSSSPTGTLPVRGCLADAGFFGDAPMLQRAAVQEEKEEEKEGIQISRPVMIIATMPTPRSTFYPRDLDPARFIRKETLPTAPTYRARPHNSHCEPQLPLLHIPTPPEAPTLGLQPIQIETALTFLPGRPTHRAQSAASS